MITASVSLPYRHPKVTLFEYLVAIAINPIAATKTNPSPSTQPVPGLGSLLLPQAGRPVRGTNRRLAPPNAQRKVWPRTKIGSEGAGATRTSAGCLGDAQRPAQPRSHQSVRLSVTGITFLSICRVGFELVTSTQQNSVSF